MTAASSPSCAAPGRRNDFLGSGDALAIYRAMLLIRRFEEKAGQLYGMGLIGGFCHLYIGQEAVLVGMKLAAREDDPFITGYRQHGHLLASGVDPKSVMAELTGRRGGLSGGKGGSMHMYAPEKHYYGGHGVVGAPISLGTGLAFANKYRGDGRVCLCFFGDGAADQGQAAESFLMAERWSLPIVYVVENNRMGVHAETERLEYSKRGAAFNIPGETVDGMDVEAVREAGARAIEWARDGGGPYILEMRTMRYRGHSMSDPAKYRRKDEAVRGGGETDPLDRARAALLQSGAVSEADLKQVDARIRSIVAEAAEFAMQSPEPDASALLDDVLR